MLGFHTIALLAVLVCISSATPILPIMKWGYAHGHLACIENDSIESMHFLAEKVNEHGMYTPALDTQRDLLEVRIDREAALRGAIDIEIPSAYTFFGLIKTGYPYVGAICAHDTKNCLDMEKIGGSYTILGATEQTLPGDPPTLIHNSAGGANHSTFPAESAIWYFNDDTMELVPYWVNANGQITHMRVFYHSKMNGFIMSNILPEEANQYCHECRLVLREF